MKPGQPKANWTSSRFWKESTKSCKRKLMKRRTIKPLVLMNTLIHKEKKMIMPIYCQDTMVALKMLKAQGKREVKG